MKFRSENALFHVNTAYENLMEWSFIDYFLSYILTIQISVNRIVCQKASVCILKATVHFLSGSIILTLNLSFKEPPFH